MPRFFGGRYGSRRGHYNYHNFPYRRNYFYRFPYYDPVVYYGTTTAVPVSVNGAEVKAKTNIIIFLLVAIFGYLMFRKK